MRALDRLRQSDPGSPLVSEESMNTLGCTLLAQKFYPQAVTVLRINAQNFPRSANTWDSMGEALFHSGDTAGVVENYRKALSVDPHYGNADFARKFLSEHAPN